MKPNSEITFSVALLYLCQSLFFPMGVNAQYQTTPGSTQGLPVGQVPGFFSQNPNVPNFTAAITKMNQTVKNCMLNVSLGVSNDLTSTSNNMVDSAERWKKVLSKDKNTNPTSSSSYCGKDCTAEYTGIDSEPSCEDYVSSPTQNFKQTDAMAYKTAKKGWEKTAEDARKKLDNAKKCFNDQMDDKKCPNKDKKMLEDQMKVYQCQMQAMQNAVQEASTAMQTSLLENQKMFGKMNEYQKEVTEQIEQVDEILGGDPDLAKSGSVQFKGLLGIQQQLNDALPKMMQTQTEAEESIKKYKDDVKSLDQSVEATRITRAGTCMTSSSTVGVQGGYALTCFKPLQVMGKDGKPTVQADANGNAKYAKQPCTHYEYIRGKIEQRAMVTSRGDVITSASRREDAAQRAAAFDSMMQSIGSAMSGGGGDTSGSSAVSEIKTWEDIEQRFGASMNSISEISKVDVRSMMQTIGKKCFAEADQWKVSHFKSKEYRDEKTKLDTGLSKITDGLDTGLTEMNKAYGETMFVLFGQHTPLNRSGCTKTDPDKMQTCFTQIRENLKNLLEGGSGLTLTNKTIKAGPNTPGFNIPCRGINGCVVALSNVRKIQKDTIKGSQKLKDAYVNASNTKTQDEMKNFSSLLSGLQNNLTAQFSQIKGNFQRLGIDAPEAPKYAEGEVLELMEGPPPENAKGPYKMPKNMANALSGMMTPSGLVDFADTGLRDPLKQLADKDKERKSSLKDQLKDIERMLLAYSSAKIKSSCSLMDVADASGSSDRVSSMTENCGDCSYFLSSCETALSSVTPAPSNKNDLTTCLNSLKGLANQMSNQEEIKSSEFYQFDSYLNKLAGVPDGCSSVRDKCKLCSKDGKSVYTADESTYENMVIKGQ